MIDPNKPIIDTRTKVVDDQLAASYGETRTAAYKPTGTSASASNTASATGAPSIATTIPDEFKGSSNQELIDYLEKKIKEHKPLSDEDLAKIRRRQKAEGIISGISDAVSSVANMVFTSQYAPNMYNATEGMSARAKARFEKEKADREAEDDRYFNYAMTLANLRRADKDRGLRLWQTEHNLALKNEEAAQNRELHPLNVAIKQAQGRKENNLADKAGQDAIASGVAATYAPVIQEKKATTEDARAASYRASAAASMASAAAKVNSSKGEKHHFMGKEYASDKDYTKDVREAAMAYNRRHMKLVEKNDKNGKPVKEWVYEEGFQPIVIEDYVGGYRDRKPRQPEEYAGEVERRLKEEAADNQPPSRRKQR